MKGLSVVTCPWNNADVAVQQAQDMVRFRKSATPEMKDRYMGMLQTIWSGAGQFLDNFYGLKPERPGSSQVNCFKSLFTEIGRLSE
jgi:hypothetical protein